MVPKIDFIETVMGRPATPNEKAADHLMRLIHQHRWNHRLNGQFATTIHISPVKGAPRLEGDMEVIVDFHPWWNLWFRRSIGAARSYYELSEHGPMLAGQAMFNRIKENYYHQRPLWVQALAKLGRLLWRRPSKPITRKT